MLFSKLAILFIGLVMGYGLGIWSTLRYIKHRRVTTREVVVQVRDVGRWLEKVNHWVSHWLAPIILVLMIIATYSVVHGDRNHNQDQSQIRSLVVGLQTQSDCLTRFANRMYDSLTPRQKASEALQRADQQYKQADQEFSDALGLVLSDTLVTHASPATQLADALKLRQANQAKARAVMHANAVAARLSNKRSQNPYPLPPKKACPQ